MALEKNYIFRPKNLQLKEDTDLVSIATTNENSFIVEGITDDDKISIVWYSEDRFSHSYFKYKTQKDYNNVVLSFEAELDDNTVPYNSIDNLQYLTLVSNNTEYEIPLAFYSSTERLFINVEQIKGNTIPLQKNFIKFNSVELLYEYKNKFEKAELDKDFKVDYINGIITVEDGDIPQGAKIQVTCEYHNQKTYTIDFSNLYTGVHHKELKKCNVEDIEQVVLSFNIKDIDEPFRNTFKNITVTGGDLGYEPTSIKEHNYSTIEEIGSIFFTTPQRATSNLKKLGYNGAIQLIIGDYLYKTFDSYKTQVQQNILINWLRNYSHALKQEGFKDLTLVLNLQSNRLPLEWKQVTSNGSTTNILNPNCKEALWSIKDFLDKVVKDTYINNQISLHIAIKNLKWHMEDENNKFAIFDTVTKKEFSKAFADTCITDFQLDNSIGNWLNSSLLNFASEIKSICNNELDLVVNTCMFSSNVPLNSFIVNNQLNTKWTDVISNYIVEENRVLDGESLIYTKVLDILTKDLGVYPSCINYVIGNTLLLENRNVENLELILSIIDKVQEHYNIKHSYIYDGYLMRTFNYFIYKPVPATDLNDLRVDYEITLCKANKEPVTILAEAQVTSIERQLEDVDRVELTIPFYIKDRFSHKLVKNINFELVREDMLLNLSDTGMFVIKEIEDEVQGINVKKHITAYSLEHKLLKRPVELKEKTLQLYSFDEDNKDGILNILEEETSWRVGHIDKEAIYEDIDNKLINKYRYFESIDTNWYSFLTTELVESFDIIVVFDSINKILNIFNRKSFGKDSGMYLSESNYIKLLKRKTSSEDIVTRLKVTGKEEMTINKVNYLGTDYIEDFSYFKNTDDMSQELIEALNEYERITQQKYEEWQKLDNTRSTLQDNINNIDNVSIKLNEEVRALTHIQASYIQSNDNENLKRVTEKLEAKKQEQKTNNIQKNVFKEQLDSINAQITELNNFIDKRNIKDEQGRKIFNDVLLSELDEFIYIDTWSNDTYLTPESLLQGAKEALKEKAYPSLDFDIDVVNFLQATKHKSLWQNLLFLGDYITIEVSKMNQELDIKLVGFTYNPNDSSLTLSFSNKEIKRDSIKKIGDILADSQQTTKTVDKNKYIFNKVKNLNFQNSSINKGTTYVSQQGSNKTEITGSGICTSNVKNNKEKLVISSGTINVSNDGFKTTKKVLDSTGRVVSRLSFPIEGVSDSDIGLSIYIPIHTDILEIRKSELKLSLGRYCYVENNQLKVTDLAPSSMQVQINNIQVPITIENNCGVISTEDLTKLLKIGDNHIYITTPVLGRVSGALNVVVF